MHPAQLLESFIENGISKFFGVPDSLLYPFTSIVDDSDIFIVPNEGNAVAMAFGYFTSTKKDPVIFLQNSGIGNILDSLQSLTSPEVYNSPMLYLISWRGKDGKDASQHNRCGMETKEILDICNFDIYDKTFFSDDTNVDIKVILDKMRSSKKNAAILVDNDFFSGGILNYKKRSRHYNQIMMKMCEVLSDSDILITSTGIMTTEMSHCKSVTQSNFSHLPVVGSLGQALSIGCGIALCVKENKSCRRIYVIDGDGSLQMQMGALAIPAYYDLNITYILLNNEKHLSVGGESSLASKINFLKIAEGMGFKNLQRITVHDFLSYDQFDDYYENRFIEIQCNVLEMKEPICRAKYDFNSIKEIVL